MIWFILKFWKSFTFWSFSEHLTIFVWLANQRELFCNQSAQRKKLNWAHCDCNKLTNDFRPKLSTVFSMLCLFPNFSFLNNLKQALVSNLRGRFIFSPALTFQLTAVNKGLIACRQRNSRSFWIMFLVHPCIFQWHNRQFPIYCISCFFDACFVTFYTIYIM